MAEAKKAIQRIVTDESGNIRIIYVDLETLKTVPDPSNYQVVNANQQNIEQVVNINDPDPVPLNPTSITDKLGRQTPLEQSRELLGEGGRGGQEGVRSVGGNNPTSPVDTSVRSPETLGAPVGTVERSSLGNSVGGRQRETSSNPVGVATAENSRRNTDNPTGRTTAGFINDFSKAEHRKGDVSQDFQRSVTDAVANTRGLGPQYDVQGFSGKGDYGSARHRDERGVAMDFNVIDPTTNQRVTDERMNDLASQYAYANPNAGIGYGQGYMSKGSMHLDQKYASAEEAAKAGASMNWGAGNQTANMSSALRETIDAARAGNLPTPFDNPGMPYSRDEQAPSGYTAPAATGDYIDTNTVGGLSAGSIAAMEAQRSGISPNALDRLQGVDVTKNPASLATAGYVSRDKAAKESLAETIAGELGPGSLKGLKERDPTALAEFSNIMSSIENRAAMDKNQAKGLMGVISPSQYNSNMAINADVTKGNFAKYGDDIMSVIDDYYAGDLGVGKQVSSYYNPDISNPSWGNKMSNPEDVGDHRFGHLAEYSPGQAYESIVDKYSRDQVNNQTSKGGFQADLGRFSDMTGAVGKANGESQGGRGRGGYAAGGNSTPAGGLGQESSGGRGRGGYAAGGNSNTSAGGRSSGAADKDTSSYGGAKDSGDAQSSGRSGGSSTSSGGKSGGGGGGRAGGVGTAGVGGGFASVDKDKDTPGGRTSGKTDDN